MTLEEAIKIWRECEDSPSINCPKCPLYKYLVYADDASLCQMIDQLEFYLKDFPHPVKSPVGAGDMF